MAEVNPPIFLADATAEHTAEGFRRALHSLTMDSQGVMSPTELKVTQSDTPGMSVKVATGRAWILGSEETFQGAYFVDNQGSVTLNIAASDPDNDRIDLVVAQVKDSEYSGVDDEWELAVITGTPAGSPSPPATPDNALVLAQVLVAEDATSILNAAITDRRVMHPIWKAPRGFITRARSTSSSASTSGTNELTLLTTSAVTPPVAGRIWRVSLGVRGNDPTVATDLFVLQIKDDGTVIADSHMIAGNAQQGEFPHFSAVIEDVAVESHTFTATIFRALGTGTTVITATATSPMWLMVEDIGGIG